MIETVFVTSVVAVFGVLVGSFLNVVNYRVPRGESIVFPGSRCPACSAEIGFFGNIPILSWLFLGGKCYTCKAKISIEYPIVELLTGALFLAIYFKLGLAWYAPFVAFSFTAILSLAIIDIEYMAVPDSVNFMALAFALIQPEYINAIMYTVAAAGGLYLISLLAALIARKQAMGGADVIVAGTMGALLGFPNFFVAIFLAAILSIIPALIRRKTGVPFVPFLAIATFVVYIYDQESLKLLDSILYL